MSSTSGQNNIAARLTAIAHAQPQQPAIIDGAWGRERECSFQALEQQVCRFSNLLIQLGAQRGDIALILQPMSLELYVILLALFRCGMAAMFVDPSAGRTHLSGCCARIVPKLFIGTGKAQVLRLMIPAVRRIPIKISSGAWPLPNTINYRRANGFAAQAPIVDCEADTPALITFTSGSTGQPKAAVRSHGFLSAQHRALADSLQYRNGQIDMTTLPIFVLANLASGITSLIPAVDLRRPGYVDARTVLDQIQRFKPQRSAASPAFYERLIEYCKRDAVTLSDIQRIDTGGAPVFPNVLAELQDLVPSAEVYAVYGSTEAEPIAHCRWSAMTAADRQRMSAGKGLLVGTPVACINLRIIRDHGVQSLPDMTTEAFAAITLSSDMVGEIVVSGEHVLSGYLDGVGDEQTKFSVDGKRWHRTGDAGYLDVHGRLWLLGRCSAKIDDARGVLYPFAVETVARSQAAVARAACLSFRRQRYLLLQLKPGCRLELSALSTALAWADLDVIRCVAALPMDKRHNAKVDYPALQRLLQRQH